MKTKKHKIITVIILLILFGLVNNIKGDFIPKAASKTQECYVQNDDEEFVLFIVDFSNSMTEKLHGTKKINMVLDTMQILLPQLPPNKRVGLRVYGHKGGYLVPGLAC